MNIFESHAHYVAQQFNDDREKLLNNLKNEGIEYVIEIGDNVTNSKKAILLSKKYDFMYSAIGIHPESANDVTENDYEELEKLLEEKEQNKIVAIGEIGLDYYYTKDNIEKQKEVFIKQLDIAKKYNLPVVIHSREATEDTLDIIKKAHAEGIKGVIHCFPGSVEIAKEYEKMGYYIGVGGVVTFKNGKKLAEVVENIPLSLILLETDSPYLAPEPKRGTRNDSSNLIYIARRIAEIKNVSVEEVIDVTNKNAKNFFGIK